MSDNFSLKSSGMLYGHLTVTVYDVKNGKKKLFRITKKNQITNKGREVVLALLAQDPLSAIPYQANPEYNQIWSLGIGTGSAPADVTDTTLYSEVLPPTGRMVLTTAEREYVIIPGSPGTYEIQIHKELPAHTLTGTLLAEAGLFTRGDNDDPSLAANNVLYARQIHPVFEKGEFMAVEYDWRLGMLVQL